MSRPTIGEVAAASRRWMVTLGVMLTLLVAAHLLDGVLFGVLQTKNRPRLESRDWWQFLRAMGYLPTWLAVGAAVMLHDARSRWGLSRGVRIIAGAGLGGLAAEIAKIAFARQRPINNGVADGVHVWGTPFESLWRKAGNYGLPSSHAAVAFGAAFVVARVFPRAGPVAVLLAAGCGVSRMLSGAHFASDVVGAACLGYAVSRLVTRELSRGDTR